jgi:pimeloyl-ACP methyl ester carboxylesterase
VKVVEVAGQRIAYRELGQGPPLVFLHGFLTDSRCWVPQISQLSDEFRTIGWDAPGAGASPDPPDTFTTALYAECLAGFLDTLGIDKAHFVGLSWGGILLQEFYRSYGDRVATLVLAGTYAGWKGSLPETTWKERLRSCLADSNGPPDALVAKFLPGLFAETASSRLRAEVASVVAEFHPVGFRLMARSSAEVDTRDLLPRIRVPTLLIWGDDDRRSPLGIAEQFHTAIPGAEFVLIRNAGHLTNMEQPSLFNSVVRRFCHSPRSGSIESSDIAANFHQSLG